VKTIPRLVRSRSRIAGWGVYAGQMIAKGTRIVEYKGEIISQPEARRRELRYLPRRRIWVFDISRQRARDAGFGGNTARYINHACRPNCHVEIDGSTIWIVASRSIRKKEELTYDYNTGGTARIPCHCRPNCRRIL
jgi:SET domain-containing protein